MLCQKEIDDHVKNCEQEIAESFQCRQCKYVNKIHVASIGVEFDAFRTCVKCQYQNVRTDDIINEDNDDDNDDDNDVVLDKSSDYSDNNDDDDVLRDTIGNNDVVNNDIAHNNDINNDENKDIYENLTNKNINQNQMHYNSEQHLYGPLTDRNEPINKLQKYMNEDDYKLLLKIMNCYKNSINNDVNVDDEIINNINIAHLASINDVQMLNLIQQVNGSNNLDNGWDIILKLQKALGSYATSEIDACKLIQKK